MYILTALFIKAHVITRNSIYCCSMS